MFQAVIRPAAFVLISVMLFASGHLSSITLATLSISFRGESDLVVGILTALPFLGMLTGSLIMQRVLRRTRHVRLIALSTAGSGLTLMFLPMIDSLVVWALLRFAYGVFAAGVWLCFDTWMADIAEPKNRGKTLAFYQVVVLSGIAIGQVLLVTVEDHPGLGFNIATAAMVAAVLPICSTKLGEPAVEITSRSLPLAMAWKMSPLSLLGSLCAGLCFSNYTFVLLSYTNQGIDAGLIAGLGSTMMLAGIVGQFVVGYLSDRLGNRRRVMQFTIILVIVAMLLSAILGIAVWPLTLVLSAFYWGLLVTLYPISVAMGSDIISRENFQPFAAKAFLSIQCGLSAGPLLGGMAIALSPSAGPLWLLIVILVAFLALSFSKQVMAMHVPATTEEFAPMSVLGVNPVIADPRSEPSDAGESQDKEGL